MPRVSLFAVVVISACTAAFTAIGQEKKAPPAGNKDQHPEHSNHPDHAKPASAAAAQFESLKKLAGTWTGKANHGEAEMPDVTVIYKVTAADSAVMETLFPGTAHEMITMYTIDGDNLVLTHYCSMGNQPHMKLVSGAGPGAGPGAGAGKELNVLHFVCTGGGNMKESDAHMHDAKLTIVDADHIKSAWIMSVDGKPGEIASFDMTRSKT
jgi:hypothetical protein